MIRGEKMKKNWYEKSWVILFFLIAFPLVGIYLMWRYDPSNKIVKILLTILFITWAVARVTYR